MKGIMTLNEFSLHLNVFYSQVNKGKNLLKLKEGKPIPPFESYYL